MELTNGNENGLKRRRDWSHDDRNHKKVVKSSGSKSNSSSNFDDEAGHFYADRGFKFTDRCMKSIFF